MSKDNMIRVNKLKEFRAYHQLNQKEFATRIDMNVGYYCRLEKGELTITNKTLEKIANVFNVPYEYIIDDKNPSFIYDESQNKNEEDLKGRYLISHIGARVKDERHRNIELLKYFIQDVFYFGDVNDFSYISEMSKFFIQVHCFLEYKEQLGDDEGSLAKLEEEGKKVLDILMNIPIPSKEEK